MISMENYYAHRNGDLKFVGYKPIIYMKSKVGKEIYIKELNQIGTVTDVTALNEVRLVSITKTDGEPVIVNVLEKGYTLLTIFAAIWQLVLKAVGIFQKPKAI